VSEAENIFDEDKSNEEVPPQPQKRGRGRPRKIISELFGEGEEKKTEPEKKPAKKNTNLGRPRKRTSVKSELGMVWKMAANFVAAVNAPTAKAVVLEAPIAGQILDDAVAGTVIDRWLIQPFAGASDKYGPLVLLIGFPAAVYIADVLPEHRPMVEDYIRKAIVQIMVSTADEMKATAEREAHASEQLAELGSAGITADGLMTWLFEENAEAPAEEPEPVDG
jgi:hypothetical protein